MYSKGDTVIYPHHGACVVEGFESRDLLGKKTKYLVLRATADDLKVSVPEHRIDEVGLRPPVSVDELNDLVAVLQKQNVRVPTNWSRRLKNHREMLRSGDVYQVAEVVRNLSQRKAGTTLSHAESDMLLHARTNLENEIAPALGADAETVASFLDEVLAGTLTPPIKVPVG